MKKIILANVITKLPEFLKGDDAFCYAFDDQSKVVHDEESGELEISGMCDFSTYLNSFSIQKYIRYTGINEVYAHIEFEGDTCCVAQRHLDLDNQGRLVSGIGELFEEQDFISEGVCEFKLDTEYELVSFAILSEGKTRFKRAYYYALVPDEHVRDINIALCTTTYKKEEFILRNLDFLNNELLAETSDLADHFHVYVVDNARTLDADEHSTSHVSIIGNPNVGGAGGFARGMMEVLESGRDYSHVVLMDDDVQMLPESFVRLYALLSVAKDEYEQACVNGAMMQLEHPAMQYEDVSYMRRIGGYQAIKPLFDMGRCHDYIKNEKIDVEVDKAYGAWWFSCIPVSLIRKHGLPLPLFIRCDDVEYGLRLKARYMTLNGICVWHAQFQGRFNAAIVCYQYARNLAIVLALHQCYSKNVFRIQFYRTFSIYMRTLDYASAELWLDGLEDYLKGPDYLTELDGNALLAANSEKSEKLKPLSELNQSIVDNLVIKNEWLEGDARSRSRLTKLAVTIPHDRHWFPKKILLSRPGTLAPGAGDDFTPWSKVAMRKTLVSLNIDGTKGYVRHIDYQRYKQLKQRYKKVMRKFLKHYDEIAQQWRDALDEMSSLEYWHAYLEKHDKQE